MMLADWSPISALYHGGPFTIKEHYESKGVTGVYRKYVSIPGGFPGGSLIGMPTAVVDIIPNGSGTKYDAMILYSCVLFVQVRLWHCFAF